MTVMQVNSGKPIPAALFRHVADLPAGAPIIVMIHGYRFSPDMPQNNPHRHILALDPDIQARRVMSWPRALGFGNNEAGPGLAIAYGWNARGRLRHAYREAERAGVRLARLITTLSQQTGRPVAVIAHSMGARVALSMLRHVPAGAAGRMILLAGAEFRCRAEAALDSPGGRAAEIINITSRENDLFDFGLELMLTGLRRQTIGLGLRQPRLNWVDIQIDCDDTLAALSGMGFPMDGRAMRMCHWSPYLRDGVFDFYRTALRTPWALPLGMLRARLPQPSAPRWSRLLALPEQFSGQRA